MEKSSIHPLSDSVITYRDHDPSLLLHVPSPREAVDDGGTRRTDGPSRRATGDQFFDRSNDGSPFRNLATPCQSVHEAPLHRSCPLNPRGILLENCETRPNHALSSSVANGDGYPSTLEAARTWDRFAGRSPRPYYINLDGGHRALASSFQTPTSPASAVLEDGAAEGARGTQMTCRAGPSPPMECHADSHRHVYSNPNTNDDSDADADADADNSRPTYAAHVLTAASRADAAGNAYTSYVIHVEIVSPSSLRSVNSPASPTATATAIVEHRYSEFHKLQNQLLANRIALRAPFPKKHWAGNLNFNWNLNLNLNLNLNFDININSNSATDIGGLVGLVSNRGRSADDAAGDVSLERGGGSDPVVHDDVDADEDDVPRDAAGTHPSDGYGGRRMLAERAARSRAELIELRKVQLDLWLNELCRELNRGVLGRLGDDDGGVGPNEKGDAWRETRGRVGSEEPTKDREVIDEDGWEDVLAASVTGGATATRSDDENNNRMTPPTLRQQVIEFLTVSSANRPPCDRYNPVDWDDIFCRNHQKCMPRQQSKSSERRCDNHRSYHNSSNKRRSPTKIDKDASGIQKVLSNPLSTTLGSSIRAATYTLMNMCGMRPETAKGKTDSRSLSSSSALRAMKSSDRGIPLELLQRAKGLVFLTVAKMGFLVSGRVGTGLIVARLDSGSGSGSGGGAMQHKSRWSAPSAIGTVGVGWGALVGGDIATYLIVLTTRKAVAAFSSPTGTVNLGAELGIAVGPVGRGASGHVNTGGEDINPASFAPAYAYVHSKGLFVGISIESSVVSVRRDVNSKFYGREVEVEDLLAGRVERPRAAQPLYDALDWCLDSNRWRDRYLRFRNGSNGGNEEGDCYGGGAYDDVDDDVDDDYYDYYETAEYPYGNSFGGNTQLFESMTYNGRNYGDDSFHGGGCLSYSSCR
ncbi:hypothetical protein ACHAXS_013193 [Conticribra weissflogii]